MQGSSYIWTVATTCKTSSMHGQLYIQGIKAYTIKLSSYYIVKLEFDKCLCPKACIHASLGISYLYNIYGFESTHVAIYTSILKN